jgi:hypothetical protein
MGCCESSSTTPVAIHDMSPPVTNRSPRRRQTQYQAQVRFEKHAASRLSIVYDENGIATGITTGTPPVSPVILPNVPDTPVSDISPTSPRPGISRVGNFHSMPNRSPRGSYLNVPPSPTIPRPLRFVAVVRI